jgi:hypothetical protein
MFVRRPVRRNKVTSAISACAAALLAFVLLADVAHAQSKYIYCVAMRAVMTHACCKQHRASTSSTAALSARGAECCKNRVAPSLGTWTASDRSPLPDAPPLATFSARRFEPQALAAPPIALRRPSIRSGPPLSRVLAQLMVLQL